MSLTRHRFLGSAGASVAAVAAGAIPFRARAAGTLRVAVVPEVATTSSSTAEKQPLVDMLQRATGMTVALTIPTNYAATVEALGNGGADLAYLGGLTYVKAHDRYAVRPLVQRASDREFHSLFIASAANAALANLKDLKGKRFAFGDVNSTSGHLIPAKEMLAAGIDVDSDIHARFTGNHTATALAVNSGAVDAGALDESVYRKLVDDKTIDPQKARVFYTSAPFVDYVWVTSKDLDPAIAQRIANGFLHANDPHLYDLLRAKKFVTANDGEYDDIRAIAKRLNLL